MNRGSCKCSVEPILDGCYPCVTKLTSIDALDTLQKKKIYRIVPRGQVYHGIHDGE